MVRQASHQEDQADVGGQGNRRGDERVTLAHAHFIRQVSGHVAEQQVERHSIEAGNPDTDGQAAAVPAQQFADRRRRHASLAFQPLFHLQELGCVLQAHADITSHQAKRRRQQKWQAPAPAVQVFSAEQFMQGRDKCCTKQQPGRSAGRHDAGVQPPSARRCILGEKCRSAGILARSGKALHEADQQQQARRPQADLRMPRQQANAEGRNRHDQDRQ
ncbi:hypothetical protein D3C81_1167800 [compost metagenome]